MKPNEATPSAGSFAVLCFPFAVLGILLLADWIKSGDAGSAKTSALCLLAAVGFFVWLKGHAITIRDGNLVYRNGFYRTKVISLESIDVVKNSWIDHNYFLGKVKTPSLTITDINRKTLIEINDKIFSRGLKSWIEGHMRNT